MNLVEVNIQEFNRKYRICKTSRAIHTFRSISSCKRRGCVSVILLIHPNFSVIGTNNNWKMWQVAIVLFSIIYCSSAEHRRAVAVLDNKEKGIQGKIIFEETDHGILIHGNITGLTEGEHGFHVHEKGDVSDPKCLSAGGHFNPFNKTHGGQDDTNRHVGDLGNIVTDGKVTQFSFFDNVISFSGDANIIGRAIVIHENPDDLGRGNFADSNTTGHAGSRLACAVIKGGSTLHTASITIVLFMICLLSQR